MNFLYPGFLFALSAIAIPIIIHLFNFRKYKKVYFSNVRFLKEVQQETQSRNRLRQWLILAARILAIVCLVLAFAQPFIPGKNQDLNVKGDKAVSVYIDNSYSMDARARDGRLLELAIRYAEQIGEVAGSADRIQLLTSDFEGRHQVFYSPEEYDNLLTELRLSPSARPLSEVAKRQADLLNKTGAPVKRAYIISDFQKSISDFQNLPSDSSIRFQLIPVAPNSSSNLYIDSCWLLSPEIKVDAPITMKVRIVNHSDQNYENIPLQLSLNNEQKAPVSFSVGPRAATETELNFTIRATGFQEGKLTITDQQILFDDKFYFAFEVLDHLDILRIRGNGASAYIERLFAEDPYFRLKTVASGQVDYSLFPSQQLIILDEPDEISSGLAQELKKFTDAGGNVLIIPPARGALSGYGEFSRLTGVNAYQPADTSDSKIASIEADQPFFRDVFESIPENMDMPVIRKYYPITGDTRRNSETLLKLRNGRKFMSRDVAGKGYVYMLAVSLDESFGNFPRHAIFVPALIKTAFSSQRLGALYHTVGRNDHVQIAATTDRKDQVYKLKKEGGQQEFIPEQRTLNTSTYLYPGNNLTEDGIYSITLNDETVGKIAMNYDRKESIPDVYTAEEIQQAIETYGLKNYSLINADDATFKKILVETEEGIRLWKLFIILALLFLAAEILLIRFLK